MVARPFFQAALSQQCALGLCDLGTWWVSTSKVYDERTTYPVHAGSVATDNLKAIHWDGARTGEKEPAVLILSGTGPNTTQQVDENGKDSGPPR